MNKTNKDLTVGKPTRVLWAFCLPLFGSIIFQQLYNLADSFVAGKFVGEEALAAVGNGYEITLIFIAFAFGCNIGCSVVVSKLFGGKKYSDLKTAVFTTFIASAVLCAVLMAVGLVCCTALLSLINTPTEILPDSRDYLTIYIWGLPFVFFYNVSTGIFSALGDSKTPFFFLAASSLANIGVDILFVTAIPMGVKGVAWATFLCQGVSCVLAVLFVLLRLRKIPKDGGKPSAFSRKLFKQIALIAVPSILQQSFVSIGNIIIQGVINGYGTAVMAGYSGAIKLNNLVITSLTTLANGISNFTAQNLGAGKKERIESGLLAGLKMVWIICVPLVLLYTLAGQWLLLIFLNDTSGEAMATGTLFLYIVSPFYFIVSAKLVADGILRGAGLMIRFMIATFTDLVLRVTLAICFSSLWGTAGIWIAWPVGWSVATAASYLFAFTGNMGKILRRKVRPLREKEIQDAQRLIEESFTAFVAPEYTEEGRERFRAFIYGDLPSVAKLYGVFEGGRLMGALAVRDNTHVCAFFVKTGEQGKGYGGALMRYFLQNAAGEVTVNASPYGEPVYEKLGFEPVLPRQERDGMVFTPMRYPAAEVAPSEKDESPTKERNNS